jgi:hypothetical protein
MRTLKAKRIKRSVSLEQDTLELGAAFVISLYRQFFGIAKATNTHDGECRAG